MVRFLCKQRCSPGEDEQMEPAKTGRIIHSLLLAAGIVIIVAGLHAATSIIVPILISVFISIVILPMQNWLIAHKIPGTLSILLTLIAVVLIFVGFGFAVGGSVKGFADKADEYQKNLAALVESVNGLIAPFGLQISVEAIIEFLKKNVFNIFKNALLQGATFITTLVLVLLTILFVLFEAAGFSNKLKRALGEKTESKGRIRKIQKDIQQYLLVKTLISLATGLLIGVSLAILGLDFPVLWGLLAFLLNYIPSLGSILAAGPPILLALLQFGSGRALGVAIVFVAVNILLGNLVEPGLMGRRLGLSALVVFLSLLFWGWVWGPFGMILSVPLTMIIKIMLENTDDLRWIGIMLGPAKEQRPRSK
jgi:AI-2 transport protein TqsA